MALLAAVLAPLVETMSSTQEVTQALVVVVTLLELVELGVREDTEPEALAAVRVPQQAAPAAQEVEDS